MVAGDTGDESRDGMRPGWRTIGDGAAIELELEVFGLKAPGARWPEPPAPEDCITPVGRVAPAQSRQVVAVSAIDRGDLWVGRWGSGGCCDTVICSEHAGLVAWSLYRSLEVYPGIWAE